jgi:hypothetical protein
MRVFVRDGDAKDEARREQHAEARERLETIRSRLLPNGERSEASEEEPCGTFSWTAAVTVHRVGATAPDRVPNPFRMRR